MSSPAHPGTMIGRTNATSRLTDDVVSHSDTASQPDLVNHPAHYKAHPSGVECIQVTEHMGFNVGNAMKYLWRADEKGNALEDLRKAGWYVAREIQRRGSE